MIWADPKEWNPFNQFDAPLIVSLFLNHFLIGVGGDHYIFMESLKRPWAI